MNAEQLQSLKTIISYYEKDTNQILNDWIYWLGIHLVRVLGRQTHLLTANDEIIGYFYSLVGIVNHIDPLVDLMVK